ncbi:hypothetical protein ACETAC_03695 [Aceticella autotrophica]|uniref:Uncharacterized protein n=1 Tax=Aceticella autotrophica TaxID=2755338 RepID=A0A975GB25_9THEO|nr:hypothetical protein [Aceticella autotrophica]QSZ27983.1 hypothetical protein ACETAC_03695 [Aceticella autotrophica]
MAIGIIDVREWQTMVDLKTGDKIDIDLKSIDKIKKIIAQNYYPGDFELESIDWVSDMAMRINEVYEPDFMLLSYAQPYFISRFKKIFNYEMIGIINYLFKSVENFLKNTDFVPVIIGLGDLVPLRGFIDLSNIDGIAFCGGMSSCYGGLFDATSKDLDYLAGIPEIEKIISKKKFMDEFGGREDFIKRFPDYLLIAKEGYTFKACGSLARTVYKVPAKNTTIPLYTSLDGIDSIVDVKKVIEENLDNRKIALILLEGIGTRDFKWQYTLCKNSIKWYTYEQDANQYLAITTGKHLQYNGYPPGYKYYIEDDENKPYPYEGPFMEIPENTIGQMNKIKSAALGSRSIITHVASGADISIECLCRMLYNYGTMAVIKDIVYKQEIL